MRLPSYLVRNRLGIFYLRIVLPKPLRWAYPTAPREIRQSLHTRDPRHAKMQALQFAARFAALITHYGKAMTSNSDAVPSHWLLAIRDDGKLEVTKQAGDDPNDLAVIIRTMMQEGNVPAAVMQDPLQRAAFTPTQDEVRQTQTLLRQRTNAGRGEWLYDAILRYRQDMETEERWRAANTWASAYQPTLRHFREIIAPDLKVAPKRTVVVDGKTTEIFDILVAEIEDTHIRQFKSAMSHWPKGFGQGTRGDAKDTLTAKDALAMTHLPRQSPGNVIKKCEVVKAFLRWAHTDGCIREGDRFAGILPSKQRSNDAKSKRGYLEFTPKDLRTLFESAEYRDNLFKTGAQYWVPLIGLYTGARINEIAQLHLADIKISSEGIRCFHITDAEDEDEQDGEVDSAAGAIDENRKSVKTDAARRMVPVHPKLIAIGLDRYIAHVKAQNHTRLFPELTFEPKSGYGRTPSRTFRDYTKRYGVYKERKKVFHSFRSTLNGKLQVMGMDEECRSRLIGHATKSVNDRYYGGKTALMKIEELLSMVDFGIAHPTYSVPAELPPLGGLVDGALPVPVSGLEPSPSSPGAPK